ncbi:MFS transporter [Inquilinus sp. Marseille-Q2685]|uniref:MFS transporter n=1 Tax=Inquilinus sp. Marseille-Q2685 TaxID=2866581 RepID=UPI001CE44BC7|nr:MFS transporter [Inquilinus sp. Marseille-Q2685]
MTAAVLVNAAGGMVVRFLALYLSGRLQLSADQVGWTIMWYGVGVAAGGWLGSRLSDRWPPLGILLASLVLNGSSFIALGVLDSLPAITALLLLAGIAQGSFRPSYNLGLRAIASNDVAVRGYSLYLVASNLGGSIGSALGGFLALWSFSAIFWVNGTACILAAGVVYVAITIVGATSRRDAPPLAKPDAVPLPEVAPWQHPAFPLFIVGLCLVALTNTQATSTYPLFLEQVYAIGPAGLGLIFSLGSLIIVLFQVPLSTWSAPFDPFHRAAWGGMLLCLGYALLPVFPAGGFAAAMLLASLSELGLMLFFPASMDILYRCAGHSNAGRYMAWYQMTFAATTAFGPAAGGWVYTYLGGAALWGACGVAGFLTGAALIASRWFDRTSTPSDSSSDNDNLALGRRGRDGNALERDRTSLVPPQVTERAGKARETLCKLD